MNDTAVPIRAPLAGTQIVGSRRPQVEALSAITARADGALQAAGNENEIGAMAMALIMHRRRQLGGDIPTPNDYQRFEHIKRIVLDAGAAAEPARDLRSHDQSTRLLQAIDQAVQGDMPPGNSDSAQ